MMDLSNKSTKELKNSLKAIKLIATVLLVVILLLLSLTIYGLLFKNNNATFIALFAVGISCSAILPLQYSSIKKIKNELKLRNE